MEQDPIKILLIEDEPDLRETLAELLQERGYEVETVASGSDAVDLARRVHFDVVVTDIRTEGQFDGLSALEKVKEHQPSVAGVVITGYSTEDYALRAVKLKVEDYLKKPFQLSTFIQRIESIASQRRRSKQAASQEENMRQTILWFSEQVAQGAPDQKGLDPTEFLDHVEALASKLELGAELTQELKIAAALALSEEAMALEWPSFLQETLPSSVWRIISHRYENWVGNGEPEGLKGEEIPIGSRVLKFAFATAAQPEASGQHLDQNHPGQFDPTIVALHDSIHPPGSSATGNPRSVLAVGLALEDAGEFEQALDTFKVVASDYPGTRTAVLATLGQARLSRARGNLSAAAAAARRSFALARRQGPALAAACGLQAGILLSQQNEADGESVLTEACERLNEVREVGGRAVSILALAHFWGHTGPVEVAARTLVSSEFTSDLVANASWLVPFLLGSEQISDGLRPVILEKCAQDCPSSLLNAAHNASLEESRRVLAIEVLAKHLPTRTLAGPLKSLLSDDSERVRALAQSTLQQGNSNTESLPTLRLYTFGGFKVYRGEERLDSGWRRQKPKFFLAYLANLGTSTLSDDSLVEVFWEGAPEKGRASLRAALSYLRRQLVPAESSGDVNYFLKPPGMVQLNPELPIWYDLSEMERCITQMRKLRSDGQVEKAVATARKIMKLYEGPFLENCFMDWAIRIRDRTDHAVSNAALLLADWCLQSQRLDEAVEYGQRAVAIDPTLEPAHLTLVQVYLAQSKPQEALRQCERCQNALAEELGVELSEEMVALRQRAKES